MAVEPNQLRRGGDRGRERSRALAGRTEQRVPESVAIERFSAASSSVVTATSSPGSALAASWAATSIGMAHRPRAARRRPDGRAPASPTRGCYGAHGLAGDVVPEGQACRQTSTSRSAAISSPTGGSRISDAGRAERSRQLVEGERPPQRGGDRHHRCSRTSEQPPHPLVASPSCTRLGTHPFDRAPPGRPRPAVPDARRAIRASSSTDQKRAAVGCRPGARANVVDLASPPSMSSRVSLCIGLSRRAGRATTVRRARLARSSSERPRDRRRIRWPVAGRRPRRSAGRSKPAAAASEGPRRFRCRPSAASSIAIMIGAFERGLLQEAAPGLAAARSADSASRRRPPTARRDRPAG